MVAGYERYLPLDIDIAHPLACDGLLLQNDICGVPDDDTQLVSKSTERTHNNDLEPFFHIETRTK